MEVAIPELRNGPYMYTEFHQVVSTNRTVRIGPVTFIETLHRPGAATGRHAHQSPRLCLVVSGSFCETFDDHQRERAIGSLLLYPADVSHDNCFAEDGARCLNVRLPSRRLLPSAIRGPGITELGIQAAETAYRIYDGLRGREGHALVYHRTRRLLDLLLSDTTPKGPAPETDGPVTEARCLVERDARRGISLATVAQLVGMDRFELARAFRARFGYSVGEYRHRVLVRRSREALLSTDLTLAAIALRIGFADQSHFTRIFKRHTGISPGQYRQLGD